MKDLLEVLEINSGRLPRKCTRAVKVVQGRWAERGQPMDGTALVEFLDQAITFCAEMELTYPKILLKRLKQLQRGEWQPARGGMDTGRGMPEASL
jgi:hypothetical protein